MDASMNSPSNIALSGSCGGFSTGSVTPVAVTNLSVSGFVTNGRPVRLSLVGDGSDTGGNGSIFVGDVTAEGYVQFKRGSTVVAFFRNTTAGSKAIPVGAFVGVDSATAGTYTYSVEMYVAGGTQFLLNCKLLVEELI